MILTEYNKLKKLLEFYEIPFEEVVTDYNYQLIYPSNGPDRKSDVVIGLGTYGNEMGLLEQMGLLPADAIADVEGWLTANEVFKRWAEDYGYFVAGLDI